MAKRTQRQLFSIIVKGLLTRALAEAKRRGIRVLRLHNEDPTSSKTVLIVEATLDQLASWFNEAGPFSPGSLLHYRDLSEEETEAEWQQAFRDQPRMHIELDALDTTDAPYSVSTRTSPQRRNFADLASAISYARRRARSGPRRLPGGAGGKMYFIVKNPDTMLYRVFRAMRGLETRPGAAAPEARRECVVVQRAVETLPNGKIRWLWDHGLSVEIQDLDAERDKLRRQPPKPRMRLPGERE